MILKNKLKSKSSYFIEMKKIYIIVLLFFIQVIYSNSKVNIDRQKTNFGIGWYFTKDSLSNIWEKITIPHTAQIEPLVVNNQWQGNCWYKKDFKIVNKNKKVFIYFEGVMHESWIWINGKLLKHHQGGYLPFTVDASNVLLPEINTIIVKVNNQDNPQIPPGKELKTLDFNYYGGIYRNVYLINTNMTYITDAIEANEVAGGGVFINFNNVSKKIAKGTIKINIKNNNNNFIKVKTAIVFTNKKEKFNFNIEETTILPNSSTNLIKEITIKNPELWDTTIPNLYNVELVLSSNSKVIDKLNLKTGIRKIEIKEDGFFLNDNLIYINGTNRHQEYPYIGYALSDEANYRDAVKIKNAGFNFVRGSHYPHSESFMNACDELGIMVMNCISGWQFTGDTKFLENSYQEIKDLARRDRNHPSVIFWEVSLNESDMKSDYMKKANELLKNEIPYKNIYTAGWLDNENYDLFIPARQHSKPPNYWNDYKNKNRKILIAEYGDWEYYAQNAGFNQTAFQNLKEEERTSRQLRAFGEKRLLQQAFNYQESFNSNLKGKNTIGHANWLMFDYNRGYADDLESSGISDIFRIPKFAFYFYKSQRSPKEKLNKILESGPMIHIASYWNENSPLEINIFSNCEEVELFLNDQLIARQKPTINEFSSLLKHPPFVFKMSSFIKGNLKAIGYINGKIATVDQVQTANEAKQIKLEIDSSNININPNNQDVVFIYAKILDDNGVLVSKATNTVYFSINETNAELIGENPVKAEAGIATILLRTKSLNKTIQINAKSEGLKPVKIEVKP